MLALVGLNNDWKTIGVQLKLTKKTGDYTLGDNNLSDIVLDPNASPTGFPWHTSARSGAPCFYNLGSAALE